MTARRDTGRPMPALDASTCDDQKLWALTQSVMTLPALAAALRLGLFEALRDRPLELGNLATAVGASRRGLSALIGFLASVGLVTRSHDTVGLREEARVFLLADSVYFWGSMIERIASLPIWSEALLAAVRSGKAVVYASAGEHDAGEMWDEHAHDPARARAFNEAAHARAAFTARKLAEQQLLAGARSLLDVGGGQGTYALTFAARHPDLRVRVLELASTARLAERCIADAGLEARVCVEIADMFAGAWPAPQDAVWFSDIFHDWSARECRLLAERAFACLRPDGRVYVCEVLLDEDRSGPLPATSYDLAVLFSTQSGRQYTFSELWQLLESAGFSDVRVVARAGIHSVVSARKRRCSRASPAEL